MIESIFDAIGVALNNEFGDAYKVYPENQKQGFKEPCFFVQCINPTHQLFLGMYEGKRRYYRENLFCIQYFPADKQRAREEIHSVCERMEFCLDWIRVDSNLVMGTAMHYEIADDVLSFFVSYNFFFIYADYDDTPADELQIIQNVSER